MNPAMHRPAWIRTFRRRLIAGLIVIAPIGVTAFVLWWIFQWVDSLVGRFVYPITGRVPGLGFLLLILLLFASGWATERAIGHRIVTWWHAMLERIPVTRPLFSATNRIVRSVFGRDRRFFRDVVLVQFPSAGRWCIGFLTSAAPGAALPHVPDGVTVFVPTAPNPTSGFLVIVPRHLTIPLSMTTEEAFTFLLSAGSVPPEQQAAREAGIAVEVPLEDLHR